MAAFEVIALDTATPQLRAPGASDTYTFPRAVEMPLGTANGVLYLNGSKVVTSGTDLVFNATGLGIGTSSPVGKLDTRGTAYLGADANNALVVESTSSLVTIAAAGRTAFSTSALRFLTSDGTAALERMRIDSSGNLGIGTSNPQRKLHIVGAGPLRMGQSADYFEFSQSAANLWAWISDSSKIALSMNGANGSVILNDSAIATNATGGFLYVAGCDGTPTGTPTSFTGRVPIVVDTTNHKLYFYSGGAWRDAGP